MERKNTLRDPICTENEKEHFEYIESDNETMIKRRGWVGYLDADVRPQSYIYE